jgi:hypothetical protein
MPALVHHRRKKAKYSSCSNVASYNMDWVNKCIDLEEFT